MRTQRVFSDLLDKDMMKVIPSSELMENLRLVLRRGVPAVNPTDPSLFRFHRSPFFENRRAV
jgi:hypothetical protein